MKNKFSKLIAAFMALAFVLTMIPATVSAAWSVPSQAVSTPDLRMGLLSDCHIRGTDNSVFTRALRPFKEMGGVEAIGIVGDLVYTAAGVESLEQREALYTNALNGWNSVFTSNAPEMIYTMGNHEFTLNSSDATQAATAKQAFKNKIGDYDSVRKVNGFTFITAAPKNYLGALSSDTESFIMTNAQAAIAEDPNKPVFLLIHHPPKDIFYGTMYTNVPAFYSSTFYNFLHTTPQIVFICGHSHPPIQDPKCIHQYQGGYTCLDMPMSGLTVFRYTGYEQDELWSDRVVWDYVSGTYLMEVKDNVVYIHKLDVLNNRYVGEPYVIDVPKMVAGTGGYNYTDARYDIATAPTYPEDAAITLSEPEAGKLKVVFANTATKTEESAPGMADNFVMGYQITLRNASTNAVISTKKIYGDFFKDQPSVKQTSFSDLTAGTRYRVSVAPVSAFNKVGNEVSKEILIGSDTITGYTFRGSSVTYDGQSHMINVTAGTGATDGVTVTYTVGGAPFSGATEIGTYPVTATITKAGYNDLVLSATLRIKDPAEAGKEVLLDLDFSNFSAVGYTPTEASVVPGGGPSGVTASGMWASGTTLGFSKRPSENAITKETIHNANDGITYYVDYVDEKTYPNVTAPNSYNQHLINMKLRNEEFEDTANTISFWADVTASNVWKEIFAYRVDFGGSSVESFDLGINADGTWNALSVPTSAKTISSTQAFCLPADASGEFTVPKGWKHIVITNPVCSGNKKTMDVYINGAYVKSVTLDIPDNAAINTVSCSFFSKANSSDGWWRTRDAVAPHGTLGGFKVYQGVLSAADIIDLYNEQLPEFSEGTPLSDITGYTFEDATAEYDGESHSIAVTAASDATEGVNISYTVNGAPFTGATEVGTYNIKATLTKEGYNNLELTATLTIDPAQAPPVDDGEVLVDLDFTDLAPTEEAGASGIVNRGTLTSAQLDFYSSNGISVTTDFLYDKDDLSKIKKVMRISHNYYDGVTTENAKQFKISDPALENQDITLSFWTNIDPISKQTAGKSFLAIAQYNAKRDNGTFKDDNTDSRATLWQYSMDTNDYVYWGTAWKYEITMDKSKQWHHVVMTIPKFSGGAKAVKVYIDGEEKLTENVNLGGHALAESWIGLGCSEAGRYIPGDISYADVKIFAGAMSPDGVSNLYDSEKDFYNNMALNSITVKNASGAEINKLTDLSAGSMVTVSYSENIADSTLVFAVCRDESGKILSTSASLADGSGTLSLTVPEDGSSVNVYTWSLAGLSPLQKITTLYK
ncbi:MAG: hypothetical protein J5590_07130 [Clostridia bacterium]|nr:hypothetical protein [Clostridia bacterium]